MPKNAQTNYWLLKNWSMVWLAKTNVGVKTWSSCRPTSKASSEMCFWHRNLSHILEHFQPDSDTNSGKTTGFPTFRVKRSPWLKESIPSKFCLQKPSRQDGKTRVCPPTTWVSRMPLSFLPALDGPFLSILSSKAQTGFEVLKETTSPPSTLTRNIGWGN